MSSSKCSFITLGVFAIIATILNGIVLIGCSNNVNVISNLSWAYTKPGQACLGYFGCFKVTTYLGIFSSVTDIDDFAFADDGAVSSKFSDCSSDGCESCDPAMKATLAFVVLSLACSLPSMYYNFARSSANGNNGPNKASAMAMAFGSILFATLSVIIFGAGCQAKAKEDMGSDFDWVMGPSFGLMIAVIGLKIIEVVSNAVLSCDFGDSGGNHSPVPAPADKL